MKVCERVVTIGGYFFVVIQSLRVFIEAAINPPTSKTWHPALVGFFGLIWLGFLLLGALLIYQELKEKK